MGSQLVLLLPELFLYSNIDTLKYKIIDSIINYYI